MKYKVTITIDDSKDPDIFEFDYCISSKNHWGETRIDLYDKDDNEIDWFFNCSKWDIVWELNEE